MFDSLSVLNRRSGWLSYQNPDMGGHEVAMPLIRPISDLRNRAREISRPCHASDRPVFITRNGESNLVVMSQAHYDRLVARLEVYQKLDDAERQASRGRKTLGHREMMTKLRARLG